MNIQDWFPLRWTGWISLQPKGLSRVFSNSTDQKHQFFSAQSSLWSSSHIHGLPWWLRWQRICLQFRRLGLIPGLERSSGVGHGYPLQYSCLENSVDRGAWQATAHRVTESDATEWLTFSHFFLTTRKTIALTIWTFVGKVIPLLFNAFSMLVIAFLPRS